MHDELPLRPRIRPGLRLLYRCPGEIQVGLDPRHATVIRGLPESVIRAVGTLAGHRTTGDLLDAVGPDEAGRSALRDLLVALTARGLVQDAEAVPTPSRLLGEQAAGRHPATRRDMSIAVHGNGRLAVAIACLLAGAGVGRVHVAASGRVQPEDTGTGYHTDDVGRGRSAAARDALRRVDATVATARFDSRRPPDLVLLTDAVVPDPELVALLFADDQPHLTVHVRDGVGIVGPLVVPGQTSCLRCADLRRSQVDQCWPRIATQLAGHAQLADVACTQATAGFAAAQALDALTWSQSAHTRPATWNASVEIDPFSATTRHRAWPPHPGCPCRDVRGRAG